MGVVYEIVCVPCSGMASPGRYRYIGETARNAYTRGREHLSMLRNKNKASVLWKHCRDVHSGNMIGFKMSVIKRYKNDAMKRQIMESVIIESSNQEELLNDKTEWNYVYFPRVSLM